VPIPKRKGKGLSAAAQLMQLMKKGDSLWLPKPLVNAVQMAQRYLGKGKYAVRSENRGTRVWKLK
jgi:hypothetical protein